MVRPNWTEYFLRIATDVATRATCLRRKYGAVIVKDDRIISTGYCGAPRGRKDCLEIGTCERQKLNIPPGQRYELCRSVHAEMNAIINADPLQMKDATIYISGIDSNTNETVDANPCKICERIIINAKIKRIIYMKNREIQFIMN